MSHLSLGDHTAEIYSTIEEVYNINRHLIDMTVPAWSIINPKDLNALPTIQSICGVKDNVGVKIKPKSSTWFIRCSITLSITSLYWIIEWLLVKDITLHLWITSSNPTVLHQWTNLFNDYSNTIKYIIKYWLLENRNFAENGNRSVGCLVETVDRGKSTLSVATCL